MYNWPRHTEGVSYFYPPTPPLTAPERWKECCGPVHSTPRAATQPHPTHPIPLPQTHSRPGKLVRFNVYSQQSQGSWAIAIRKIHLGAGHACMRRDERSALVPRTPRDVPRTRSPSDGDGGRSGPPGQRGAAGGEFFSSPACTKSAPKHYFRPLRPSPPPCPGPHFGPDFGCKFAQEWVCRGWEKIWHVPLANPQKSPPNGVKMRHFK